MSRLRTATVDDAPAVAAVHVAAWRDAYRGLLPEGYLAALTPDGRQRRWEQTLAETEWPVRATLVAETAGAVVGFVSFGPSRDADSPVPTGEVAAVYVDPRHWRSGIGARLIDGAVSALRTAGCREVTLWVLEQNARAQHFYRQAGWNPDGGRKDAVVAGVCVTEIRYRRVV